MSKQQSDQGQQSLRDRLMQLEAKEENEKAKRNAVMEAFLRRRTDEYNRSTGENIVLSPPGDGPLRIINPPSGSIDQQNSDVNQDSLDGAQAFVSEVGSAEEFTEKDNIKDIPSEENPGDVPDHYGHESREAEDGKENGGSAQDANGAEEEGHYVDGKNGEAEADSTENRDHGWDVLAKEALPPPHKAAWDNQKPIQGAYLQHLFPIGKQYPPNFDALAPGLEERNREEMQEKGKKKFELNYQEKSVVFLD